MAVAAHCTTVLYTARMAAYSDPRQHLHALIDELEEPLLPQAAQALADLRHASLVTLLRDVPDLQVPQHWPPQYAKVEPLTVSGEPVSEQLIRERR